MKLFIICILLFISLIFEIKKKHVILPLHTSSQANETLTDTINFTAHVQPILVLHCSPCHFTGGKMYERLPFDKDTTIINHNEGILRRIKDAKENELIKLFVEQQKEKNE